MTPSANWYDAIVLAALLYGIWSGLRTGLTGEIIRVIGLVLMLVLALACYEPVGGWITDHSQMSRDTAQLVAFISIAVVVYLISVAVRLATHRRMKEYQFSALVENVGGVFAGVVRMAIIMAWLTAILTLSADRYLQHAIGEQSRFGSLVVGQFPALQSAVQKNLPGNVWFMRDLKRRPEQNYEEGGATNTNTNHLPSTVP